MFPRRRLILIAWLLALFAVLGGCASLIGPRTIVVSEAQLQDLIARRFPFSNRFLQVLDVNVAMPRLSLRSESERIAVELQVQTSDRFLKTPYTGTLTLTCGLRFEPGDNTIRFSQVRVERFEIEGAPEPLRRNLGALGSFLTEQLLEGRVIYTLRPKDLEAAQGRGYRPGSIRVTARGVEITLDPI
jgi:hypothetical protein